MTSRAEKRPLEKDISDQENQGGKRQRVPALASVIVEAVKLDSLQKLCSTLEPLLRRVVGEEVERVLARMAIPGTPRIGGSPLRAALTDGPPELQLHFKSKLALPLFTGSRIEGDQGSGVHVVLQDVNTGKVVTTGPAASAKLEVCVLEGDFNADEDEMWSPEAFEQNVVKERDGKRPLLTGDLTVTLKEGVGTLGELSFTDNSSWIRSRKFRLGVRVAGGADGIQVREAKTEAFTVKDHRGELYKKHYPPALHDEVWRLDRIGKDGAFHKRLNQAGIFTVEDFLRMVVTDPQKLRNILGSGMSNKMWEGTVEHAKTCVLNGKLHVYYADEKQGVGVIFNNIFQLMGLIADGQYISVDVLSDGEKVYVDKLVKVAYENWDDVVEYDGEELGVGFRDSVKASEGGQPSAPGTVQPAVSIRPASSLPPERQGSVAETPSPAPSSNPSVSLQAGGAPAQTAQSFLSSPGNNFTDTAASSHAQAAELRLDQLPIGQSSTQLGMIGSAFPGVVGPSSSLPYQGADVLGGSVPPGGHNLHAGGATQFGGPSQPSGAGFAAAGQAGALPPLDLAIYGRGLPPAPQQPEETLFDEDALRVRSAELLENEDMLQLLHNMLSTGSLDGAGPAGDLAQAGDFSSLWNSPAFASVTSPGGSAGSGQRNNGKAFVGWLKLKAALRWGIFIRKRAAARRARIQEVEED